MTRCLLHSSVTSSIIGGGHIHIFVFCVINFLWNWLFLRSVNIWMHMPPPPQLSSWLRHCYYSACVTVLIFQHFTSDQGRTFKEFLRGLGHSGTDFLFSSSPRYLGPSRSSFLGLPLYASRGIESNTNPIKSHRKPLGEESIPTDMIENSTTWQWDRLVGPTFSTTLKWSGPTFCVLRSLGGWHPPPQHPPNVRPCFW